MLMKPPAFPAVDAHSPFDVSPPALGPWSRTWRYLVVVVLALVFFLIITHELIPPDDAPDDVTGAVFGVLLLDLLLGLCAVCLLPLRRSHPQRIACATGALSALSSSAFAAAGLAAVSASTRRRWREIAVVGAVWFAAAATSELLWWPLIPGTEPTSRATLLGVAVLLPIVYGTCAAIGVAVGDRRRLVVSLQQRAATAEREQELKAEVAREAERTRIAREMHDVLAHRISLVAMHAGALAYRPDLTAEQTAQTAGIVCDNAQLAMTELRQVLGVLRAGVPPQGCASEPPQPTLAELPALLADAAEAGTEVRLDTGALTGDPRSLPDTVSRTAFRIVQEALTNALKHAPSAPVDLRLSGAPGRGYQVEVRNRAVVPSGRSSWGAGVGLVGAQERAELAGGHLEHGVDDGEFVVRADLPWR